MAKIKGLPSSQYHFSFYSTDCREPIHVHVKAQGKEAKIWVTTQEIAFNKGFRGHELTEILRIIAEHESVIQAEWEAFCKPTPPISPTL
ncbi:MAG: DUF4160 domain-containing protein [Candidatus Kapabacteria bacterium]|jgi:hypothetical protein|nr:DUF4160 domain-containing protein [Candidatus Kapabacteria bacterium]